MHVKPAVLAVNNPTTIHVHDSTHSPFPGAADRRPGGGGGGRGYYQRGPQRRPRQQAQDSQGEDKSEGNEGERSLPTRISACIHIKLVTRQMGEYVSTQTLVSSFLLRKRTALGVLCWCALLFV